MAWWFVGETIYYFTVVGTIKYFFIGFEVYFVGAGTYVVCKSGQTCKAMKLLKRRKIKENVLINVSTYYIKDTLEKTTDIVSEENTNGFNSYYVEL